MFPPGHAFSYSLKLAELCAAGEDTSCNIEQRRWNSDFFQRNALEKKLPARLFAVYAEV